MPADLDSLLRPAAYLLGLSGLGLAAWAVVGRVAPARTRIGLRYAMIVSCLFAINAVVVQTLGLLGALKPLPYLLICLGAGVVAIRIGRPATSHRSPIALLRRLATLWLPRAPLGAGYLCFGFLLYLCFRNSLVSGIDSLSIHGPLIVGWVQKHAVELTWRWNYPLCWEYQFAPIYLLARSDVLVFLPRLLAFTALLCLAREVAAGIGVPGRAAALLAWLGTLTPAYWGLAGSGTFKNDPALAIGILLSLVAVQRASRRRPGGLGMIQLGVFLMLGTKATGVIYAGPFLVGFLAFELRRTGLHRLWRRAAAFLALTVALQSTPFAVQAANYLRNGNPFYPIQFAVAGHRVFPGPANLDGTSVLDHAQDPRAWRWLLLSSTKRIGIEFPLLAGVLVLLTALRILALALSYLRRRRSDRWNSDRSLAALVHLGAASFLWLIFLATPWSAGNAPQSLNYLKNGLSLRYALAPIALTYLGAGLLLPRRSSVSVSRIVSLVGLAILCWRWQPIVAAWPIPATAFLRHFALLVIGIFLVERAGHGLSSRIRPLSPSRRWAIGSAAALVLILALHVLADAVERLRGREWGVAYGYREMWHYVWNEVPPGSTILVDESDPLFRYFLLGPDLSNRFEVATGAIPPDARYFFLHDRSRGTGRRFNERLKELRSDGWRVVAVGQQGVGLILTRD